MPEKYDIAALLGSRICHDLISPIGAIGNGVELLLMEGGSGPEMALISESVTSANARIRFFRVAFGATSGEQRIGRSEVVSILDDLTRGTRLQIDWISPQEISRREVKLAFLLFLCLETAMAYGGKIVVERGETRWSIRGTAAKLLIDTDLWNTLADPGCDAPITPAQVHFLLVPPEVAQQHRRLTTTLDPGEISFSY